jgi:hypothetical protein
MTPEANQVLPTTIQLKGISPETFEFIRKVCYGIPGELNMENVADILFVAQKYLFEGLTQECMDFIFDAAVEEEPTIINEKSMIQLLNSLFDYQLDNVWEKLLYDNTKWMNRLIKSSEFKLLKCGIVQKLFQSSQLNFTEEFLWDKCVEWSQFQTQQLPSLEDDMKYSWQQYIKPLIPYIRFPIMERTFFVKQVMPTNALSKDELIDIMAYYCDSAYEIKNFSAAKRHCTTLQIVGSNEVAKGSSVTVQYNFCDCVSKPVIQAGHSRGWIGLVPIEIDSRDEVTNDIHDICFFWLSSICGTGVLQCPRSGVFEIRAFDTDAGGQQIGPGVKLVVKEQ